MSQIKIVSKSGFHFAPFLAISPAMAVPKPKADVTLELSEEEEESREESNQEVNDPPKDPSRPFKEADSAIASVTLLLTDEEDFFMVASDCSARNLASRRAICKSLGFLIFIIR